MSSKNLAINGKFFEIEDTICRVFEELDEDNINRKNIIADENSDLWQDKSEIKGDPFDFSKDVFFVSCELFIEHLSEEIIDNNILLEDYKSYIDNILKQRYLEKEPLKNNIKYLKSLMIFKILDKVNILKTNKIGND